MKLKQDWEKEWQRLTADHEFDYVNDGKDFIRKTLSQREEEVKREIVKEIEVMGDVTESRLLVDGKDWIEYKKVVLVGEGEEDRRYS